MTYFLFGYPIILPIIINYFIKSYLKCVIKKIRFFKVKYSKKVEMELLKELTEIKV
jgi:hypothetical protein